MATPYPTNRPAFRFQHLFAISSGQKFSCSHYNGYSGGTPVSSDLDTIAHAASNAFQNALASLMAPQFAYEGLHVWDLINPESIYGVSTVTFVGTRGSAVITDGVCAHFVYDINRTYRGARPGSFWPFGGQGDIVSASTWSPSFVTACESAWNVYQADIRALQSGIIQVGNQVSVSRIGPPYSYVPGTTPGRGRVEGTKKNPAVVYDVNAVGVTATIGSQRRRLHLG